MEIPFADVADLEARWRALTADEVERAGVLLEDASQMIIDEGFSVDTIAATTLSRIVCTIVRRAMESPAGFGVESLQEGIGPFQQTTKYVNPMGDLYLSRAERRQLSGGSRQEAFTVDLMPVRDPFDPLGWLR